MWKKTAWITLGGLLAATVALAQGPLFVEAVPKLIASDPDLDDFFGRSVAIDGDVAIVGAFLEDPMDVNNAGSAYVFERDGAGDWGLPVPLVAEAPAALAHFGRSVAISGETAIVGAPNEAGGAGAAYVFERGPGGWTQVARLTALSPMTDDRFGISVAIDGDVAVVGADGEDVGAADDAGAAYVFRRDLGGIDNWGLVDRLVAGTPMADAKLGFSVAVSGGVAVVGAYQDGQSNDGTVLGTGAAYVFERDAGFSENWPQVAKLTGDDSEAGDRFGTAVAVDGDVAVVGADGRRAGSTPDAGAAYVFEHNPLGAISWVQVDTLRADVPATDDQFGFSVTVSGPLAVVGAMAESHGGSSRAGAAYVFERDVGGWPRKQRLTAAAADADTDDLFGIAVALDGLTPVIGAHGDDHSTETNPGAAYAFDFTGPFLSIPSALFAPASASVIVPVDLDTNGHAVASLTFSIDFDETCLVLNLDSGAPDIDIMLDPTLFFAEAILDLSDADGEIDVVAYALDPTTTAFSDGELMTITFDADCTSSPGDPIVAPVTFSRDPAPSFGGQDGYDVPGGSIGGSVEIVTDERGDCNGDGMVSAADITAILLEVSDGDDDDWTDTPGGTFEGSPAGCDANADTIVDAGDLSCTVLLIFGDVCGNGVRGPASEGPRLSLPAELAATAGAVTVAVTFEPRNHEINSMIFSLDYDPTRLVFDDLPGAVRFLGTPVPLRSLRFDAADADGELDVAIADLSASMVIEEGVLLEVDLALLDPDADAIENGVVFSADPAASFGNAGGLSVPGTAVIVRAPEIFADGFESGDSSAWTVETP